MSMFELYDFIGGERIPTGQVPDVVLRAPSNGLELGPMRQSRPDSVERALAVAARAHGAGALACPENRSNWLSRVARALEARAARLAEIEAAATGIVSRTTARLAQLTPMIFHKAAELAVERQVDLPGPHGLVEVRRRGWGPAICLAPWNAPAPIAAHKTASALAAGCPVILKPSEWAPYGIQVIAEAIAEAELPPGVFQLVHGGADIGQQLVSDPRARAVSFTGGLEGGRSVARACADGLKPVQLELGGNNPLIVLEDADLDLAVEGVVSALTTLNGQWCRALGRLLVHARRAEDLLARIELRFRALKLGDSRAKDTDMGPVIHARHKAHLEHAISGLIARGGTAHRLSALPDGPGCFIAPTLVTGCAPEDTIEEIFGPVAAVHTFESEAEAVHLAMLPPYGLAAYVFGEEARALELARRLECGSTQVNGVSMVALNPDAPRCAWRRSGLAAEGTRETFQFFSGTTMVGVAGGRSGRCVS